MLRTLLRSTLFAILTLGASLTTYAQLGNSNVSLYFQRNLNYFSAGNGNDCWGYVSPSGREYALAGLSNKVAFFDITNPSSPVHVANIAHSNSTWCGIKVYGGYAYVGTEASGSGVQVIDMTNIDNGVVTLVKTITSPGRVHTLVLNPDSKFLYTCGTNEGTGTTMAFDLTNPANPVRVGANSLSPNYLHEAIVLSYTTGPAAGKEIMYGFSEGRGVDVIDVTNKNNPIFLRRATYPSMGYCHQGWVSEDRKYLYMDDEFDENNLGVNTRTLMFDIQDPANTFYLGNFSTGMPTIDHNQYVSDGFIFQANYTSGLRIYDIAQTPTAPVQVGWYDTMPSSDAKSYNGAWSNYPFFPSGTVIVSDINGGFFCLDATEATTRWVPVATMVPYQANTTVSGGIPQLATSDDSYAIFSPNQNLSNEMVQVFLGANAYDTKPTKIRIVVESMLKPLNFRGGDPTFTGTQYVELYNWALAKYETIDQRTLSSEVSFTAAATGDVSRFVRASDRKVQARLRWGSSGKPSAQFRAHVDQFAFRITR
ncbi:MAG TPA: choice-of-anchor B family protein [Fimbriimonas sp.]|nr:choice-of-anchor B family protein [Fimbriimonas sp.]